MTVKMFQCIIDDNKPLFEEYLDNYEEDIALIKLLIKGRQLEEDKQVVEKVCYHFHYN